MTVSLTLGKDAMVADEIIVTTPKTRALTFGTSDFAKMILNPINIRTTSTTFVFLEKLIHINHLQHLHPSYSENHLLLLSLRVSVFCSLGVQAGTDLRQWGPLSDVRPRSLATARVSPANSETESATASTAGASHWSAEGAGRSDWPRAEV